jgi:hypothetical protein
MYYGARYYSPEVRVFTQPDTLLPDPYDPQALNRYSYALNNPLRYTDPSGHIIDVALDLGFIGMDVVDIYNDPSDTWAWAALGADVVCAVIPVATGGGLGVRGLKAANKGDIVTKADNLPFNIITKPDDARYLEDGTRIQNGHLAGKTHPVTGVPFDNNGFPVFDSAFDAKIDSSLYLEKNTVQFKEANLQLSDAIQNDPSLAKQFNEGQLQDIARGDTPDGYVWHHHQQEGRLQLVEREIHQKTGHIGGQKIWAGGNDNR